MSLAAKRQRLIERYSLIEDPQERLAAAISAAKKKFALPVELQTDERLIRGCTSPVWIAGEQRDGACFFRMEAGSPLVKGLVGLLCELADGEPAAEIAAHDFDLIEALGFARQLSPTRLNGLASAARWLREFSAAS